MPPTKDWTTLFCFCFSGGILFQLAFSATEDRNPQAVKTWRFNMVIWKNLRETGQNCAMVNWGCKEKWQEYFPWLNKPTRVIITQIISSPSDSASKVRIAITNTTKGAIRQPQKWLTYKQELPSWYTEVSFLQSKHKALVTIYTTNKNRPKRIDIQINMFNTFSLVSTFQTNASTLAEMFP